MWSQILPRGWIDQHFEDLVSYKFYRMRDIVGKEPKNKIAAALEVVVPGSIATIGLGIAEVIN